MAEAKRNRYFRSNQNSQILVGACVLLTKDQKPSQNGLDMMNVKGFKSVELKRYVPGFRVHCKKTSTLQPKPDSEMFTFQIPVEKFDSAELAVRVDITKDLEAEFGRSDEDGPFTPKMQDAFSQYLKIRIVPDAEFKPLFICVHQLDLGNSKSIPTFFVFKASLKVPGTVSVFLKKVEDKKELPAFWQD